MSRYHIFIIAGVMVFNAIFINISASRRSAIKVFFHP